MEQLGQVEQRSLQDLDKITQGYLYDASVQKGDWDLAAQQNALNRSLSAYGTHSGYGHAGQMRDLNAADQSSAQAQALNAQGQMQDIGNSYNAWANQGNWQMDQNRAAQDAWRLGNQYDQTAWMQGNQYANQDYWSAINQWGDPNMINQVMDGFNPWGNPYSSGAPYNGGFNQQPQVNWQQTSQQAPQPNQAVL